MCIALLYCASFPPLFSPLYQSISLGPRVTKMCLYVQQYMGTEIVLLADSGLHKDHAVLNSLVSYYYYT